MNECTECGHGARDHGDRAVVPCATDRGQHTPATRCAHGCRGYRSGPVDKAAVRAWVRAEFRAAFPWLKMSDA